MKKLRKAFVVGIMSITVLSMSVVVAPEASAAQAGDLIKMDGLSSVYYLGADGKRYVFPNEATYMSWYSDFSGVVVIAQSELESYPLGKNVTMRPGTKLVKITTNPKVYAVEPNGMLLAIPDEATAMALYGDMWASRVVDIADAFFTNYEIATGEASATAFPTGSLVKFGEDASIYYIDAAGMARAISDEAAFLANRFNWDDVITSTLDMPTAGTAVAGAEGDLTDTSSGAGGTAGAGTGLTVAISGDTPSAGNAPTNSAVDFLVVNLTAASDGDVAVNGLTLRAYDLGNPTIITSVTILDNGVKQGSSKNINSEREAAFNFGTPIMVPAGTTKSLTVRATLSGGTANHALGIKSASAVNTNGAAVSGSFPIIGNTKAAVDGSNSVGTITLSSATTDLSAAAEFGEDNVKLAGFSLAATNEPVIWESATLKNIGTNNSDIVNNMRIEVDGNVIEEGVALIGKFVTFNLGNLVIAKGDTVAVEVYGDMGVASAGNSAHLIIEAASDFSFMGQDTGYGAVTSGFTGLDASTEGVKVTLSASDFTIDMDNAASPAQDVRAGTDNVVLATVKMTSNGEDAVVSAITESGAGNFYVGGTNSSFNNAEVINFELRDVDSGAVYDLTKTASTTLPASLGAGWTLSMTEDLQFIMGVTRTFQIRADLQGPNDTNGIDDTDTLKAVLGNGAFTITGDTSSEDLDTTPTSVSGSITTVKAASLTWTTTALTAKTVVPSAPEATIYKATAKVGASSDVTLNSVRIDVDDTSYAAFHSNNLSEVTLYINGVKAKSVTSISTEGAAGGYINFTGLDSAAKTIDAGTTANIEVKATFTSSFNPAGGFALELAAASSIVARDMDSNALSGSQLVASNALTDSRAMTLAANGTLKVELKVDDSKANKDRNILAGAETTTDKYLGELVFTTTNETVKVKTLVLGQAGSAESDDILTVNLYDKDGVMVASEGVDATGNVNYDAFNHVFDADKATSLFIGVSTKGVYGEGDGMGTGDHDTTIQFNIASSTQLTEAGAASAMTAEGNESGVPITMTQSPDSTISTGEFATATTSSKTAYMHASVLTSVASDMADGALVGGTNKTIAKYKFTFDNGSNEATGSAIKAALATLKLTISTSSVTVSNVKAYIEGDSANKTGAASAVAALHTIDLSSGLADSSKVDGEVTIVVTATIAIDSGASNASVSTDIADLANGHFVYDGNSGNDATDTSDSRLDITDVPGGTLSL